MSYPLYTIGYSAFADTEVFLGAVQRYAIDVLVDVRSSPYSKRFSAYNKETFADFLRSKGVQYLFLGNELGARPTDLSLYSDGQTDFAKLAATPAFRAGCERLAHALQHYTVCLMCAEADPIDCHRAILVAHLFRLSQRKQQIFHIMSDHLESQAVLDNRVLKQCGQGQLLSSTTESLYRAYAQIGKKIAYRLPS